METSQIILLKKLNDEIKKVKSPVRVYRYPKGYNEYVEQNVRVYKMLYKNNLV